MASLNQPLRVMHIISGDLWAGAEVQAYTLLKRLNESCVVSVVTLNEGELAERLRSRNIEVAVLSESTLNSLQLFWQLRKQIRHFRPDIVHTHRQKENILGSFANIFASAPMMKRAKSIRTAHGAPEFNPTGRQKIQVWLDRWVGKHLQHAIVAVSKDLASQLEKIFPARMIHVICNGVDVEELRSQVNIADFKLAKPEAKHIGIIGRIEPIKRIDLFLTTAAELLAEKDSAQEFNFHIIGDGKLRLEMEALSRKLGLEKFVTFHGHTNDIPSYISSLDCVVICSDHEGTPMTALEAMALKTPIVSRNVGGLTEMLSGTNHTLVNSSLPCDLARAITASLSCERKIEDIPMRFNADENVANTQTLIKKLLCNE